VVNVLSSDGIKLLDQHLLGHVALVLGGRVEMTRAGGRFQLDLFANTFCHDLLLVVECRWLKPIRRGRACRPGQRRYRPCQWYAVREWIREGESSGFRFRPRNGAIADWEGNDASSCCWRARRCCPPLGPCR